MLPRRSWYTKYVHIARHIPRHNKKLWKIVPRCIPDVYYADLIEATVSEVKLFIIHRSTKKTFKKLQEVLQLIWTHEGSFKTDSCVIFHFHVQFFCNSSDDFLMILYFSAPNHSHKFMCCLLWWKDGFCLAFLGCCHQRIMTATRSSSQWQLTTVGKILISWS